MVKSRISTFLGAMALIASALPAFAIEPGDISLLGHWPEGPVTCVDSDGENIVWAAGGLLRVGWLDDGYPREQGYVKLPDVARAVSLAGDLAYVVGYELDLMVVDLSTPEIPRIIGQFDEDLRLGDVVAGIGVVYATPISDTYLHTIDVSDPAQPVHRSETYIGFQAPKGLDRNENLLYVTHDEMGLRIFDLTDPSWPSLVGQLNGLEGCRDVAVLDDAAYLVRTYWGDLAIVDVSDPTNPVLANELTAAGNVSGLAVSRAEKRIYTVTTSDVVSCWDALQDAWSPTLVGEAQLTTLGAYTVCAAGPQRVYMAGGAGGLAIRGWRADDSLINNGSLPPGPAARRVLDLGDMALLTGSSGNTMVVDVSDPTEPVGTDTGHFIPIHAYDAFIHDHLLFASGLSFGGAIFVGDVSDPTDVDWLDLLPMPGHAWGMVLQDELLYVACYEDGLQVVDAGDPTNLSIIGSVPLAGRCRSLAVRGHHAYVSGNDEGIHIVDVSNPSQPVVVGTFLDDRSPNHVRLAGDVLHVLDFYWGLRLFDVSSPLAPLELGSCPTPSINTRELVTDGTLTWMSNDSDGVTLFDCSDPNHPIIVDRLDLSGQTNGLAWDGQRLLVAAGSMGLQVYRYEPVLTTVEPPTAAVGVVISRVAPNPFNPRTEIKLQVNRPGLVDLEVVDVRGRLITRLVRGRLPEGEHRYTWDGRDAAGRRVAAGSYLLRAISSESVATAKLLLVK